MRQLEADEDVSLADNWMPSRSSDLITAIR